MWLLKCFFRVLLSAEPLWAHEVRRQLRDGCGVPVRAGLGARRPPASPLSALVSLRGGLGGPSFSVGPAWFSWEGASWYRTPSGPGREWGRVNSLSLPAAVPGPAELVRASVIPVRGCRALGLPGARSSAPKPRTAGVTSLLAPRLGLAQPRTADGACLARSSSSAGETCGAPALL